MKKILIAGANSYIGTSFEKYITTNFPKEYIVDTLDMIDENWCDKNFSGYDAIFHVAGIAHQKETKENAHLYYEVNRDLAIKTARIAKNSSVKQFVFLSSMSVYGLETGAINSYTKPSPKSNYGKSKLQAEEGLLLMDNTDFTVCVLRPPMVYGEGCKGNYQALVKFAEKLPFFPNYQNKRSMISIEKLCEYVKNVIDNKSSGIHLPQDEQYVCTCKMVEQIAKSKGKKMRLCSFFNPFVGLLIAFTKIGKKAFGNLYYEQ